MHPLDSILAGTSVIAGTGILALGCARAPRLASSLSTFGTVAGAVLGLWGSLIALQGDTTLAGGFAAARTAPWDIPGGELIVGVDPLSAFFLAPLFALGALCASFGRGYLGARVLPVAAFNLLLATMVLVLLARHAMLFLVAWETMTLLAYLLVTLDDEQAEVRRAGWVYLIASHVAVMALFALFVALSARAGGALDFAAFARACALPAEGAPGLWGLAVLGFGCKAGLVGLHVWLPEAHAAAPSHVSALMSGALVKLGVYGLLRTALIVPPDARFGALLMAWGTAGALLGIALAIYQRDLKRVLAYSTVEHIGIICLGLGLGFWARSHGETRLSALAFAGALLHLWNHAAIKGLMFLGAGSVLHGTGTKDIERLGGLLRRMPWTGRALLFGAVAIAGLPPLNGFVGEWLLFRALAQAGVEQVAPAGLLAIGGAAALSFTGGLAALCFVRLVGVVLLGTPRSEAAERAHEASHTMTAVLVLLMIACAIGALLAPLLMAALAALLAQLGAATRGDVSALAASLWPLVFVNLGLLAGIVGGGALSLRMLRGGRLQRAETWGCGYAAPTARMQYTGHAFSELFSTRILPRWAQARLWSSRPKGPWPSSASFTSDTTDPLTRVAYAPFLLRWGHRFARLRFLQQGNVHLYLLYIFAAALGALAWVAVRDWLST